MIRRILVTLFAAALTGVAPIVIASPGDDWNTFDPPEIVLVAEFATAPGLEAVYWDMISAPSNPTLMGSVSLADFTTMGSVGTFVPQYTTIAALELDDDSSAGLAELVIMESFPGGPNTLTALAYNGTSWISNWVAGGLDAAITDLEMVDLSSRNGRGSTWWAPGSNSSSLIRKLGRFCGPVSTYLHNRIRQS